MGDTEISQSIVEELLACPCAEKDREIQRKTDYIQSHLDVQSSKILNRIGAMRICSIHNIENCDCTDDHNIPHKPLEASKILIDQNHIDEDEDDLMAIRRRMRLARLQDDSLITNVLWKDLPVNSSSSCFVVIWGDDVADFDEVWKVARQNVRSEKKNVTMYKCEKADASIDAFRPLVRKYGDGGGAIFFHGEDGVRGSLSSRQFSRDVIIAWVGEMSKVNDHEPNHYCGRRNCKLDYAHEHVNALSKTKWSINRDDSETESE